MRKMTHSFFHDASILVSVGVFLTHRFETVRVFAHFLCVKNALYLELCILEICVLEVLLNSRQMTSANRVLNQVKISRVG